MLAYNEGNTEIQYLTKEIERLSSTVRDINEEMEERKKESKEINQKLDLILKALVLQTSKQNN